MILNRATGFLAFLLVCVALGGQRNSQLRLNHEALAYASQLVTARAFIADNRNAWGEHHPSAAEENEFIRTHGFAEYAKWHLGIDETHPADTKARYKFPYGDFQAVHRCGLLAAKSRAHQYNYVEIENAAGHLLDILTAKSDANQSTR